MRVKTVWKARRPQNRPCKYRARIGSGRGSQATGFCGKTNHTLGIATIDRRRERTSAFPRERRSATRVIPLVALRYA